MHSPSDQDMNQTRFIHFVDSCYGFAESRVCPITVCLPRDIKSRTLNFTLLTSKNVRDSCHNRTVGFDLVDRTKRVLYLIVTSTIQQFDFRTAISTNHVDRWSCNSCVRILFVSRGRPFDLKVLLILKSVILYIKFVYGG